MKSLSRLIYKFSTYYPKNMNLSSVSTFQYKDTIKSLIPFDKRQVPDFSKIKDFGTMNSQHMVTIQYQNGRWKNPIIKPFQFLKIHPFNSTLHYGIECYEGLKAYKDNQGKIRLFRPQCNMKRFKETSMRISLPDFDGSQLLKILEQFVRIEKDWINTISGTSLYVRPFHISMENTLGVRTPNKSCIYIVGAPVGAYYKNGFSPISITCDPKNIRSAPGGVGGFKVGGNYGPTIKITEEAHKKGHQQILWLFNGKIGQVGTSNIFFVLNKNGKVQVITPLLEDLVLPGVTRDSIIILLKSKGIEVVERQIMIDQLISFLSKGELVECFASGTAVIISPVKNIQYKGKNYPINIDKQLKAGKLTSEIFSNLLGIQEGRIPDPFGWSKVINS